MEEKQRKVYPTSIVIDKAAKPTTPLVPRPSLPQPQPQIRAIPMPPKNRGCFCRVLCCFVSLLVLTIFVIGILALVFYLALHPKVPDYSIDRLRITAFQLNVDLSLYTKFNVRVTAKNPNKKIGIYYEKGGKMSVWYEKTRLCRGDFPGFYQGPMNTTRVEVSLDGQNQYGSTLMQALQQQQQTGNIPLDLRVDQPVGIRVKGMKLGKVRFLVKCKLTIDSLSSNNLVSIKASSCKISVKL